MPLNIDNLRKLRISLGMTQQEVADLLHVSQQQYADWERGRFSPRLESIEKMSKALNSSVDYLLGLTDEPNQKFAEAELNDEERRLITLYRQHKFRKLV